MRIAFAIPGDIDAPSGGYRYDRRMLGELRALGHDVTHLVLDGAFPVPTSAEAARAADALAAADADVLLVDGLAFSAMPADALGAVQTPMVALIHHPLALETGLSAAAAAHHREMETAALGQAAGVVVTSPPTGESLVAAYGVPAARISVAVPGLDPAWHQERRPVDPPLIVAVASIIARKGYDVLIAALTEISDMPWRCAIIGSKDWDPILASSLETSIEPLAGRIMLTGELDEPNIRRHYADASVFALATRYEGFGMVFLEAMAAGLPVVTTRGGAVPTVVPPDAGILVDVDDVGAFAAGLRTVLSDPACAERLCAGARRAARSAVRWEDSAAVIAARLAEVVTAP